MGRQEPVRQDGLRTMNNRLSLGFFLPEWQKRKIGLPTYLLCDAADILRIQARLDNLRFGRSAAWDGS